MWGICTEQWMAIFAGCSVAAAVGQVIVACLLFKVTGKQRDISEKQSQISSEQFNWNRAIQLNAKYAEFSEALEKSSAEIQTERAKFYNKEHSQSEIQQFEENQKKQKIALLKTKTGLIGVRKYLESIGKTYGLLIFREIKDDPGVRKEFINELLNLGFSEESATIAWKQHLSELSKDDA